MSLSCAVGNILSVEKLPQKRTPSPHEMWNLNPLWGNDSIEVEPNCEPNSNQIAANKNTKMEKGKLAVSV